jgi:hypothetical protein
MNDMHIPTSVQYWSTSLFLLSQLWLCLPVPMEIVMVAQYLLFMMFMLFTMITLHLRVVRMVC